MQAIIPPIKKVHFPFVSSLRHRKLSNSYSKRVRFLKWFLPFTALTLISVVFFWPHLQDFLEATQTSVARPYIKKKPQDISVENYLVKPRLISTDKNGRPYSIKAEKALQSKPHEALLTDPQSEIVLEDKTSINIKAQVGYFDENNNTLTYSDNVVLESSNGYHLETKEAKLQFNNQNAQGDKPVHGVGPLGTIDAEGFAVMKESNSIHFKGKSKLIIYPQIDGAAKVNKAHE